MKLILAGLMVVCVASSAWATVQPPVNVPDGTSTAALLTGAMAAIGMVARRIRK